MTDRKWILLIPLITAVSSISLLLLAISQHWLGPAAGHGTNFCEATHEGMIKQPFNTWSNLGFAITGIIVGYRQYRGHFLQWYNPFNRGMFFSTFYATLGVLLCPGSMAMHATTSFVGGFLDLLSMYLVATFMLTYATQRLLNLGPMAFTILFSLLLGFCIIMHFQDIEAPFLGHLGSFIFACFLLLAGLIEIYNVFGKGIYIDYRYGFASMITMFLAFFIWNISKTGTPWCDPAALIQGHGIWHLLNATALYFVYRYYVSEHTGMFR